MRCILLVSAAWLAFLSSAAAQFETRSSNVAPQSPTSVAAGDFNGDGNLDIAVSSSPQTGNDITVFLGNGGGTFRSPTYYSGGINLGSIATADFNHDGKLDLAVAGADGIGVLLGNGDGTFQTAMHYSIPNAPFLWRRAISTTTGNSILYSSPITASASC